MKKSKTALFTACVMSLAASVPMTDVKASGNVAAPVYGSLSSYDIIYGDVNDNGKVQIADAVLLSRYIEEEDVTISEQGLKNADYNQDGDLTMEDVTLILCDIARLPSRISVVGDLNGNGYQDFSDLRILLQRYCENTDLTDERYDLNSDGQFTINDLCYMRVLLLDMGYSDSDIQAVFKEYDVWFPSMGTSPAMDDPIIGKYTIVFSTFNGTMYARSTTTTSSYITTQALSNATAEHEG